MSSDGSGAYGEGCWVWQGGKRASAACACRSQSQYHWPEGCALCTASMPLPLPLPCPHPARCRHAGDRRPRPATLCRGAAGHPVQLCGAVSGEGRDVPRLRERGGVSCQHVCSVDATQVAILSALRSCDRRRPCMRPQCAMPHVGLISGPEAVRLCFPPCLLSRHLRPNPPRAPGWPRCLAALPPLCRCARKLESAAPSRLLELRAKAAAAQVGAAPTLDRE